MKFSKLKLTLLSSPILLLPPIFLTSCQKNNLKETNEVTVSTFNVSFAVDNDKNETYDRWVKFFSFTNEEQNTLIEKYKSASDKNDASLLTKEEKENAERIIQIRNIAAIIQYKRPDILLLNEFNNDGNGSKETIELFQKNYLSFPQSLNSFSDTSIMLEPIFYPFYDSFATNTGLESNMDLDNDGIINSSPNDAYGFGYYHGHYAFALLSKYELISKEKRTFQNFLIKDIPNIEIPKITVKEGDPNFDKIPQGMKTGDNWYSDEEWNRLRLSSKNHVDIPVKINNEKIHLLLSHPTPPAFDTVTKANLIRNYYEVIFWKYYIENASFIYDDNGSYGGLDGKNEKFVILGDLNSDPFTKNEDSHIGISELLSSQLINQKINKEFVPTSIGAAIEKNSNNHPFFESRTSTFGKRADYSIPSHNSNLIETGVYWAGVNEQGRKLFNDVWFNKEVSSKTVSSDHRYVWSKIRF